MIVRKWTSVLVHSDEDLTGVAVRRRYPVWGSVLYGYSFTFLLLYYIMYIATKEPHRILA